MDWQSKAISGMDRIPIQQVSNLNALLRSQTEKENRDRSLQYGMDKKSQKLIHIDDAKNGLACNLFCPECGEPLVAVHPLINRINHFRHAGYQSGRFGECSNPHGVNETILHIKGKEYIERTKCLHLPEYLFKPGSDVDGLVYPDIPLSESVDIHFDQVILEKPKEGYRPDCIGILGDRQIMIEIMVHHKVDERKREKVMKSGDAMVEIDLSRVPTGFDDSEIEKAVNNPNNIRWICCPYLENRGEDRITKAKARYREMFEKRKVYITNQKMLDFRNNYINQRTSEEGSIEYRNREKVRAAELHAQKSVVIERIGCCVADMYSCSELHHECILSLIDDLPDHIYEFITERVSKHKDDVTVCWLNAPEMRSIREEETKKITLDQMRRWYSEVVLTEEDIGKAQELARKDYGLAE